MNIILCVASELKVGDKVLRSWDNILVVRTIAEVGVLSERTNTMEIRDTLEGYYTLKRDEDVLTLKDVN